MQAAVILSAAEYQSLTARLDKLEQAEAARRTPQPPPDQVMTTAQAAAYIGLSVDALLRARRKGRLPGVRLNERDWGFRRSALDAYPRRFHRPTMQAHAA
ncbi:helix-turn-helix transcriptional regulator [Hymenobacter weizhouensis]|uniref:helix-turn-helix transcriptional regulator n=1 Tax=Hymenobacter sp. YIM 151500-1 TaxID=2987689 RepID=UPI002225B7B7|nr:helix-turn-helix domain-containing protein [Hymenobacter sp. YIM 151500-1]UYZ64904.1 helix-turn-helix domain-containing protein [Hymenobacter sp. YIM 151500-1]